ncbi:MAG: hypothetical protein JOZ82_14180 [Marmoricola sp.]|nr:hypothetical protein [Marmoricola sp.]
MRRDRFVGAIAGAGSTSGVRVVVGRWDRSPLGSFADVMVAEPSGRRVLLAPSPEVAEYVGATYSFDEVVVGPVGVSAGWHVSAPGLSLSLEAGARSPLGWLLRAQPRALATSIWWSHVTDPVARLVLPGVRTRGSAGGGRRETYGATDLHRVTALRGEWRGTDLGELAPVTPEPGFGFGSTPRRPGVTTVVTTVEVPG